MNGSSQKHHYEILENEEVLHKMSAETFNTISTCPNQVDCCEELLKNCNQDPIGFFGCLMTGDKIWIHHCDLASQQEAKTWKKPGKKTLSRPRVAQSAGKIIMTIFWDCKGVLLVDFLPCDTTTNGPYYASLLHRLRSSIQEKYRRET